MTIVTREAVMTALYSLVAASYPYALTSRRLQLIQSTSGANLPALFVVDHDEDHVRHDQITPAVRAIMADVWLYIDVGLDPNTTPITTINNLIDAIDPISGGVLKPDVQSNRQTLGGLAYDCRIEGKIVKVPGDIDGLGLAIIPIKIIMP